MKTIPRKWFIQISILIILIAILTPNIDAENITEKTQSPLTTPNDNGTLCGYVYDTNMNPLTDTQVRVYFHGTYEEDYTDSNGYYYITNIPLCYCLKNCTAYKPGYKPSWILLSIGINTSHIFILPSDSIIYVGGLGPGNYSHIQDAINNAQPKDTIYVYNGTYIENLTIKKTLHLIGEDKHTTIIDANHHHDTIYIGFYADATLITGFTIQNSGNHSEGGARFDTGLEIHSDYNTINHNIIQYHPLYGMVLWASKENNISYNLITNCTRSGIDFLAGPNNTITHNIFTHNQVGISALGSTNCKHNHIAYNTFHHNYKGLAMYDTDNHIYNNNFLNNYDWNAMSHFNFWQLKPSRNIWHHNYWDDWKGFGPKWIPGFLGFNFDRQPTPQPYPYPEDIP